MFKNRLLLISILFLSSCTMYNKDRLSQKEILGLATGELALDYSETYSYQNSYAGVHGAKVSGGFTEIYDNYISYLDESYRVQYFLTALWVIPFEGGELSNFTETLVNDSCHDEVLRKLKAFLENEENYNYQPEKHRLVKIVIEDVTEQIEGIY